MKISKLKKVLAGFLAFVMVAGYTSTVSAATSTSAKLSSSSSSNFDEALEQLNDATWSEYYWLVEGENRDVPSTKIDLSTGKFENVGGFDTAYPAGTVSEMQAELAALKAIASPNADQKLKIENIEKILKACEANPGAYSTPDIGQVTWTFTVEKEGLYALDMLYYPTEAKSANIERTLRVDGEILYSELRNLSLSKIWVDEYKYDEDGNIIFEKDESGNESRPSKAQKPAWTPYTLDDATGYYSGEFVFFLKEGTHTITLEAQREPMLIADMTLRAPKEVLKYKDYIANYTEQGIGRPAVSDKTIIRIEAENPSATSDRTIYPTSDRTSSINAPMSAAATLVNTLGGTNWSTVGQWSEWTVNVEEAGLYTIYIRFSQNYNSGIFVSRKLTVDGNVPFDEANYLEFMYDDAWQLEAINDGTKDASGEYIPLEIYLDKGEHTIGLEVTLGHLGDIIKRVRETLAGINSVYLKILQITGPNPDAYTDYKFYSRIPKEIQKMGELADELYAISEEFQALSGVTSSNTATLENIARILEKMAKDSEGQIAKNFSSLKSNIGTLGTWINTIQKQSLIFDYLIVAPVGAEEKLPAAEATFWQDLWFEVQSFFYSFIKDDDSFTSNAGENATKIDVWTVVSREYTQIIRNLVKDDFAKSYPNIAVNLKLVSGATLLPATLAGQGPDVMMGTGENTVINYAVRGALVAINDIEGVTKEQFDEVSSRFLIEAMRPVTVAMDSDKGTRGNGDIKVYGIPHTMSYSAMFYRTDVFAELGISIPKTWDDFRSIIPRLQSKNYTLGMTKSLDMFILQAGADIYKDDGEHIAYGEDTQLDAFTTMTEFFTLYTLPMTIDSTNRFRTGEAPIIVADLVGFYNQFTAFATELKGLWSFSNVPGTVREDGTVDASNVLAVTSLIIMKDAITRDTAEASFRFIEWWTRDNIQSSYANELIAVIGNAAKYNTANVQAYLEMDWSARESKIIMNEIFPNIVGVPDMPGSYIIGRYVNFAFLAAYNEKASPSDELLGYVELIDKEFERKREELNREFFIPAENRFQDYFQDCYYSDANRANA